MRKVNYPIKRLLSLIIIIALLFSLNVCVYGASFRNQPADWALEPVFELKANGLVTEDLMNKYDKAITRKEFVRPIVLTYIKAKSIGNIEKLYGSKAKMFTDVIDDDYILVASQMGIVTGDPDGRFRPDDEITREEACAVLFKLLKTINKELALNLNDSLDFHDLKSISNWAKPYVVYCYKNNIMTGTSELTISPLNKITREEFFTMIYRLAAKNNFIPKRETKIGDLDYYPVSGFQIPKNTILTFEYPELSKGILLKLSAKAIDQAEVKEIRAILSPQIDTATLDKVIDFIQEGRGHAENSQRITSKSYEVSAKYGYDKDTSRWYWELAIYIN